MLSTRLENAWPSLRDPGSHSWQRLSGTAQVDGRSLRELSLSSMASSSSDNEDEAMAGLSLKNGHASSRGGLLSGELAALDIPPGARLCGVNLSVEEDGTKVWTVTFKAKPKPASRKQRSSASSSDGQLHRLFPLRCEAKQHGQRRPLAVPQLGSCASSGRAWRLWAARHSKKEAGPLSAQPLPRVLAPLVSPLADRSPPCHHRL